MAASANRRSVELSQNFIQNRPLIDRLIKRTTLSPGDLVLEIGPGHGAITASLLAHGLRVLAVEKDPRLADRLARRYGSDDRITVVAGDVLDLALPRGEYSVFANVPFNITAAIVAKLTTGQDPPRDAYLVVQYEAAAKFSGQPRESLASLLLKPWFELSVIHHFRRDDFSPAPAVDPVMLRIEGRPRPLIAARDRRLFRDLAVHLFTTWQPTVHATLARLLSPAALARVERRVRVTLHRPPSRIAFADWIALFHAVRDDADRTALRAISGAESRLRRHQSGLEKVHRTRSPRPRTK